MKSLKIISPLTTFLLFTKFGFAQDSLVKRTNETGNSIETPWGKGKINGIVKAFDKNGKLTIEIPYVDDKKNGIEKLYYPDGKLKMEAPYSNDKMNGTVKLYYESGRLKNGNCLH